MHIFCDFDGTIALTDTTDAILDRFADPAWRDLEGEWLAGRMDAAQCMREQIALVKASDTDIDAELDAIAIDPGFRRFVEWTNAGGLPLSLVSDGVDRFIRRVLENNGLGHLDLIANRLVGDDAKRVLVAGLPLGCASGQGVCKCAFVGGRTSREVSGPVVFIGDGRSDFCLAPHVDILFAKGRLLDHARRRGLHHLPFDNFDDVTRALHDWCGQTHLTMNAACA